MNEIASTAAPVFVRTRQPRQWGAGWARARTTAAYVAGVLVLLAAWEIAGRAGLADGFVITPGEAVGTVFDNKYRDLYWRSAGATFSAAAIGRRSCTTFDRIRRSPGPSARERGMP